MSAVWRAALLVYNILSTATAAKEYADWLTNLFNSAPRAKDDLADDRATAEMLWRSAIVANAEQHRLSTEQQQALAANLLLIADDAFDRLDVLPLYVRQAGFHLAEKARKQPLRYSAVLRELILAKG